MFAGLLAVLVLTLAAFRMDVGSSLSAIAQGAFGDKFGISRTLARATPLVLCGLGMTLAWKASMYNIGGEGQYVAGGLAAAALFKMAPGLPVLALQPALLLAGAAGGGAAALLAGWLQVKRGVQVVISTILLNFIMLSVLGWMLYGPLQESKRQIPQTDRVPRDLMLWRLDRQLDFHAGALIALALAAAVFVWLYYTRQGFKLRLVGENPRAARANLIPVEGTQLQAMALSGALCGLAGSVTYLGMTGQVGLGFAEGLGFLAIPVALLGGLNPLAVVASGLYFGGLIAGGESLARASGGGSAAGSTLVFVIQAVAVLGFISLQHWLKSRAAAQPQEAD